MPHDQNRHIHKEMIITGVSNAIINGVLAVSLAKGTEAITFWGLPESIAMDITATSVILLFVVALITISKNRSNVRKGKVEAFIWDNNRTLHRFWQRLPNSLFARALCFAALGLAVVAPISFTYYLILGVESMASQDYAVIKGLWAGIVAAIMCVPMIQLGLSADQAVVTKAQQ